MSKRRRRRTGVNTIARPAANTSGAAGRCGPADLGRVEPLFSLADRLPPTGTDHRPFRLLSVAAGNVGQAVNRSRGMPQRLSLSVAVAPIRASRAHCTWVMTTAHVYLSGDDHAGNLAGACCPACRDRNHRRLPHHHNVRARNRGDDRRHAASHRLGTRARNRYTAECSHAGVGHAVPGSL
jgi:hypothetical protein